MKKVLSSFIGLFIIFGLFTDGNAGVAGKEAGNTGYEVIKLTSSDGESDAAFFNAETRQAAVFVPGAVFSKESWFFIAGQLQPLKIASLSLNGKSAPHVLSAIAFLKNRGFEKITLVGGSMGGGAVLSALKENTDESVRKMVALAPYGGVPVKNPKIRKLFIVAKADSLGSYSHVRELYQDSSDPKILKEYDGTEHAQHMFKGRHKEDLTSTVIDFIQSE